MKYHLTLPLMHELDLVEYYLRETHNMGRCHPSGERIQASRPQPSIALMVT
jgi:hypothetical protein